MKFRLCTMSAGGTIPSREPVGKTGSAASAGSANITATMVTAAAAKRAPNPARDRVDRMRIVLVLKGLDGGVPRLRLRRFKLRHPSHGQIDPSTLRQQGGCAGVDTVDPVESEPGLATKHDQVARIEAKGAGGVAAF